MQNECSIFHRVAKSESVNLLIMRLQISDVPVNAMVYTIIVGVFYLYLSLPFNLIFFIHKLYISEIWQNNTSHRQQIGEKFSFSLMC